MAWVLKKVIFCEPVNPAPAEPSPGCLSGEVYVSGITYVPTVDPGLPNYADVSITGYVFALVITTYLLARGIGLVIELFKAR